MHSHTSYALTLWVLYRKGMGLVNRFLTYLQQTTPILKFQLPTPSNMPWIRVSQKLEVMMQQNEKSTFHEFRTINNWAFNLYIPTYAGRSKRNCQMTFISWWFAGNFASYNNESTVFTLNKNFALSWSVMCH